MLLKNTRHGLAPSRLQPALPMIDLASVDQDGRRMGRVAAEALLTRIGGRRVAEHILIEPKLIPRGSL